ncbi:MAG: HAMP domain-containing protein [Anaerolineaceae bacterium]|nr:HAMP domain-containing protein [Anaerolineaceae bacterium]
MKFTLQRKLILSYLAVALITVLVVSALIRLTSGQSLMNLVAEQQTARLKESIQEYYAATGTMDGFFEYYILTSQFRPEPAQSGFPSNLPDYRDFRGIDGLVDAEFHILIPGPGRDIGQVLPKEQLKDAEAVKVDGETVAWILPDKKMQFQLNAEEQLFLRRTNLAIGLAALAGVLAAVVMGFVLSRGLSRPIQRLTAASQALARGELEQQLPVTSKDELGQLTATFNQMSADLVESDQQRKRMTADITHDLSTPLQILSGYMEMLEDGEVGLTPQRIEIIKTEIEHLRRLVSDLSTLSQVESGGLDIQMQPVQPSALLERIFQIYEPIAARQGVRLTLDAPESVPQVSIDEGRMVQVLKNLVENALRYTPQGGEIRLSAAQQGDQVQLAVSDNGAGIDSEDLPYVFDRFFRADKARGVKGHLGLGLAICKALVTAQGGTIAAESPGKGQGARMVIGLRKL